MKDNKVHCRDVMEHICENLGEELATRKCKAIREHLAGCTCCQSYFKSVEMTIDFYRSYNFVAPDKVCADLLKKLDLEE